MTISKGTFWVVEELCEWNADWRITRELYATEADAELVARLWQTSADKMNLGWRYRVSQYVRVGKVADSGGTNRWVANGMTVEGTIQAVEAPMDGDFVVDVGSHGVYSVLPPGTSK